MSKARVWIAFVLLSLNWGSSYLWIRVGVRQLTPLALVAMRVGIGFVSLIVIAALLRYDLRLSRRHLATLVILGTLYASAPFLLITWGEETVPSGLASVLNSTVPIFSVVIAGLALQDEPITAARLGGVALGFCGVLLLGSRDLTHGSIQWSAVLSQGAIVLASLCYAISAVLTRRTLRGVPVMTVSTYALGVAALETIVLSLIFSRPPLGSLHPLTLIAVVWLGFIGSAIGYLLNFYIIANWGAARATLVTYAIPIVGLTLGAIFLHELPDWRIVAGSLLVILGVVLASLVRRPIRRTSQTGLPAEANPA